MIICCGVVSNFSSTIFEKDSDGYDEGDRFLIVDYQQYIVSLLMIKHSDIYFFQPFFYKALNKHTNLAKIKTK